MWGIKNPGERSDEEWRQRWFPYPFGISERCKLDTWASGKHLGGEEVEKLSDDWILTNAQIFFKDYEAMILKFCKTKWPKMHTSEEKAEAERIADVFVFDDKGESKASKSPMNKQKNQDMMASLLYFSSEIICCELRGRLLRAKELTEAKGKKIVWFDAKKVLVRFMQRFDTRLTLYKWVTVRKTQRW